MQFHLWGSVSVILFFFTGYGLFHQYKILRDRRQVGIPGYTRNLSAQQFVTSFAAFFSIFFLGLTRAEFNHYLVWTRLSALVLVIAILWEIHLDRRSLSSLVSVILAAIVLTLGIIPILLRPLPFAIDISAHLLTVIIAVILAYGNLHQIHLLGTATNTALSQRLLWSLLVKDLATLGFGLTMSLAESWSLLLLNASSLCLKSYMLIQVIALGDRDSRRRKRD